MTGKNLHVFIHTNKTDSEDELAKIFSSDSLPDNMSLKIDIMEKWQNPTPNYDFDYAFVKHAIENSDKDAYTIVSKDNVVSTCSSTELYYNIDQVLTQGGDFDIYYIANYGDSCELFSNIRTINDTGTMLVDSVSPSPGSMLTILLSPKGKAKFTKYFNENPVPKVTPTNKKTLGNYLNSLVMSNDPNIKFNAIVTSPSILSFNVLTRKNDAELSKTIPCRRPQVLKDRDKTDQEVLKKELETYENPEFPWFWIFMVIIFVVLICVLFYYLFSETAYMKTGTAKTT